MKDKHWFFHAFNVMHKTVHFFSQASSVWSRQYYSDGINQRRNFCSIGFAARKQNKSTLKIKLSLTSNLKFIPWLQQIMLYVLIWTAIQLNQFMLRQNQTFLNQASGIYLLWLIVQYLLDLIVCQIVQWVRVVSNRLISFNFF